MTVRAAVGMAEANLTGRVCFDQERAAMDRAVMSSAKGENISQNVATALGAQLDVVQIQKRGVAAAGHAAAVLISREHGPAQGRWDRLRRACVRLRGLWRDRGAEFGIGSTGMVARCGSAHVGVLGSLWLVLGGK
jgi:hypothetical protein